MIVKQAFAHPPKGNIIQRGLTRRYDFIGERALGQQPRELPCLRKGNEFRFHVAAAKIGNELFRRNQARSGSSPSLPNQVLVQQIAQSIGRANLGGDIDSNSLRAALRDELLDVGAAGIDIICLAVRVRIGVRVDEIDRRPLNTSGTAIGKDVVANLVRMAGPNWSTIGS